MTKGENVGAPTFKVLLEGLFNSYYTFEQMPTCVEAQAVSSRDSKARFPKMKNGCEEGGCYPEVMKCLKTEIPSQDPGT